MRSIVTSTSIRFIAAVALLHVAGGCKPKPAGNAAEAAPTSAVTPAKPFPATLSGKTAQRLVDGDFVSPAGYSIREKLACQQSANGESWGMMCRAVLTDPERGGQPAIVQIQLYDRPVDFATEELPFNTHVQSLHASATMLSSPEVSKQMNDGSEAHVLGACHQGRGTPNSAAYCAFMPPANVALLVVGVKPLHPASKEEDDSDASPEDTKHAKDIALGLLGAIDPD
jgi:hypothetical protein